MFLLFILTLLIVGFVLTKRGYLNPPFASRSFAGPGAPEAGARTILAERFARGDITSDEFMERAAVLNWTPGIDPWSPDRQRSSKRSK